MRQLLIKVSIASLCAGVTSIASAASLTTPPLLSLGLDPYLSTSLRTGLAVELVNYPSAQYALGCGVAAGLTALHRETIYEAVFLINHLRGAPVQGLNLKLTAGQRYFNHEKVSQDLALSYALPFAFAFTTRVGIARRKATIGTKEQAFLYKEKKRSDATDIILSVEFITGRLDR